MTTPPPKAPARNVRVQHGPVSIVLRSAAGLVMATLASWLLGTVIEVVGIYSFWSDEGLSHSQEMVQEDLEYIAEAPRSLIIDDTVGFAQMLVDATERAYVAAGLFKGYDLAKKAMANAGSPDASESGATSQRKVVFNHLGAVGQKVLTHVMVCLVASMYVAQDTLLRLATAVFAIPAFVLACLLGTVDGLVRRDLRRWGGGRETSYVYHHAKRTFFWALTGGFTLYLAWPFGDFNPSLMVLIFTALVAASLSTTLATFKKYV